MKVVCDNCGKRYSLDSKLIKSEGAKVKCKSCDNLIPLPPPDGFSAQSSMPGVAPDSYSGSATQNVDLPSSGSGQIDYSGEIIERKLGLRFKMLTLFLIIPLIIIICSGFLYLIQFKILSDVHIDEGSRMMTRIAKNTITEKSRAVAKQCKVYLDGHSKLTKDKFNSDVFFKGLALEQFGQKGYTYLFSIGGDGKKITIVLHPDESLQGVTLETAMKVKLKGESAQFVRILKYANEGKNIESAGTYFELDNKNRSREKYIFLSPIEGTTFGIAANAFIDEFTAPVKVMEFRAEASLKKIRYTAIIIIFSTLLLITSVVLFYGNILTKRLKSLTTLTNRISLGDMDTIINIKSKDEIEDLATAISRMQMSIKFSLRKLTKKAE